MADKDCSTPGPGMKRCSTVGHGPLYSMDKQGQGNDATPINKTTLDLPGNFEVNQSLPSLTTSLSRSLNDLMHSMGTHRGSASTSAVGSDVSPTHSSPAAGDAAKQEKSHYGIRMDLRKLMGGYLPYPRHSPSSTPGTSAEPTPSGSPTHSSAASLTLLEEGLKKERKADLEYRELNTWAPTSL